MPIVQLPDGNSVDIPDDAPPEVLAQVKEKMRTQYAGQESGGVWNAVKSGAADLGRGASRALVTMTEGTPLGMSQKMAKLFQERMFGQAPDTTAELGNKAIDRVLPTPQGDSPGRQLVRAGLQGIGGAAATGPLGAVNYAAGLGSGLGGEMAKQAGLGPIGEFAGSLLGGVGGGSAAGLATRLRPQSAAVAREALEGFTPKQFEDAQAYMNKVAAEGSNIDLAQALYATTGQQGNLTSIRNAIAGRSKGDSVQKVLRDQPTQLAREAELTNLGMPGTNWGASQNANNLQEAATKVLQGTKATRTQLWEDTVKDGVAALRASEGVKVAAAQDFAKTAGTSLAAARGKVQSLMQDLAEAKSADAQAIAGINKKIADTQELINSLQQFSLPRGTTMTNRGNFSSLPQRGQSIAFDALGREAAVERLTRGLPDQVQSAPSVSTLQGERALTQGQVQLAAAEAAHTQAQAGVTKAQTLANSTTRIPAATLQAVDDKLSRLIETYPNTVQATELSALRSKLQGPDGPLTDPAQINRIFTEFTTRLKSPDLRTAGMDAGTSKYLGGQINALRDELGQGFAPIRAANTAYKNFTDTVYNPLKQGPVGTIAQRAGYSDETGAQITAFEGLLRKGTDRNAKISDLKVATREIGKVDPNAVDDALKGHVSRLMQAAEESNPLPGGGPTNTNLAEKMSKNLFENPMQWQGLKDVMSESAMLKGGDPDAVIRGLEGVKKLAYAMKDRPPATGGISKLDLERLGGSSNTANAVRVMSFLPANRVGEMIERAVLGKTFSQFDAILTSPEGVKMLMKLGNTPVMSKKFLTILGSFGGAAGNPDGLSDSNPPE